MEILTASQIPKYCKIVKGEWFEEEGGKWNTIEELRPNHKDLSTASFAWVDIDDCIFSCKKPKFKHKDGFYILHDGNIDYSLHFKDSDSIHDYIEKLCGKWSLKTADKWNEYICVELKNDVEIDSFSY
jgi:hypothetical protein